MTTSTRGSIAKAPVARIRNQVGSATAEYAAVTAAGCGFAGVLIKLLTSDYGQQILKTLLGFFLRAFGIA